MKIEVLHARWGYEDDVWEGGEQTIENPSRDLLEGIAAAAACSDPAVRIVSASKAERERMGAAVQDDADSVKIQDAAMRSGEWQIGNAQAHLERVEAAIEAHHDAVEAGSADGLLTEEQLARAEFARAQTSDLLDRIDNGASYDEAAAAWHSERAAGTG